MAPSFEDSNGSAPLARGSRVRGGAPRVCLIGLRPGDDPVPFALGLLAAARREGTSAAVCTIGADRNVPSEDVQRTLSGASGHAVHRIDVDLMSAPAIQTVVDRAGANVDLVLIVSFESSVPAETRLPAWVDVQYALMAPLVLCADADTSDQKSALPTRRSLAMASRVRDAVEFLSARHIVSKPLVFVAEARGTRRAPGVAAASGLEVLSVLRDPAVNGLAVPGTPDFEVFLKHAQGAPPLAAAAPSTARRGKRARIGVVLDDCFDLYDEESLLQFELAGAELVPISALEPGASEDVRGLDGLLIGDGRVERHSSALSAARAFRTDIADLVERRVPTIATGGGFAYLTRGLRTASGAFHPFVGAIDAEAVTLSERPSFGHIEVETTVETLIGSPGQRLRGFVQRSWLIRGVSPEERGIYSTISGPRDEGCGRLHLFAVHFRPYWPSCPGAASAFIDRCVRAALVREGALDRGLTQSSSAGRAVKDDPSTDVEPKDLLP